MKGKSFVLLPLCLLLMCSCGSYRRLAYLQDMEVNKDYQVAPKPDTRICPDDKVRIVVTCSSPELAAPFNVVTGMVDYDAASKAVRKNAVDLEEKGYLVDQKGDINFPVLGKLHIAGLTLEELKALVEDELKGHNYIKDPIVYTEFVNFEVVVLGEAGVGRYNIPSGGVNIFELLAMAKDLTGDALRDDLRVIRTEGGVRRAYSINLKSVDCYNSPVFYLKQDDMVYALPKDSKMDTATHNVISVTSLMLSAISTIGTVLLWMRWYQK